MSDGFDAARMRDLVQLEDNTGGHIARLEAKLDDALAASDARLTSLETRMSSGFSRLECRLDRLFELQRRRRSASE
jgi:hypothetical protein